MDTARQILRFSIPGSIFLLHAFVCYLLFRRLQGVSFIDASTPVQENIAAALAVLATIPVGFVIYQFYYFSYKPVLRFWPWPWGGRFVRMDRGGQILKTLDEDHLVTLEEIFDCEIDRTDPHRVVPGSGSPIQKLMHAAGVLEVDGKAKALQGKQRQRTYENIWYTHWDVLRMAMDVAAAPADSERVKSEYTSLSDIYHSLGAARTAVTAAWLCVCVLAATHLGRIANDPWMAVAGFALISTMTAAVYSILQVARGRTWRTAAASLSFGLRWLHWRHGHELRQPPA